MKEIIVTGATIEEALENGRAQLEADADSIEYEVLEQPQQKILGIFGGAPAKLRVYVKKTTYFNGTEHNQGVRVYYKSTAPTHCVNPNCKDRHVH